jgi:outer membrane protein OmpA-like peptidoglycan-associated protein
VGLTTLVPAAARAQTNPQQRGIDLVAFKLTPTMRSGMILDGAETPRKGAFHFEVALDLNVGLLGLTIGKTKVGDLVPFRWDLHLMGSYQLHKRIEVAIDLPVTLYQVSNFGLLRDQGFYQSNLNLAGLNDVRLFGRFSIFSQKDFPLGIAAVAEIRFPTGNKYSLMGEWGVVFAPRLVIERQIAFIRLLGNIGYQLRTTYGQYLNLYLGQLFTLGGGGAIDLPNVGRFTTNQFMVEVNASTPAEAPFTFDDSNALKSPFEVMFGLRTYLSEHWVGQLNIGRGLGFPHGYGREEFRVALMVRYEFEPDIDTDGDGIPDKLDQCPTIPENFNGYQDEDGCPEPDPDSDGDGVPDNVDGCKDIPGPAEYDGCPDRDGDQIPDNVDKCPDEFGAAELDGCPAPKEEEVVLESERIRIKGNILFETGQAIIQKQSYPLLDDVAKVLRDNPDVGPVLIEGHTDNRGSRPYNLDLSDRRAAAVANYLISKGIAKKRLRTAGFGFDRPVATNDTPLGRAKNRRTEFRLVHEDSDTPGGQAPKEQGPSPAPPPKESGTKPGKK